MHFIGTTTFFLSKKLKALKKTIKTFNKDHFSNLEKRVVEPLDKLKLSQSRLLALPSPNLAM